MSHRCSSLPYVLITPARNEEAFIEKTIQSMIRQTVLPTKWVIVDDGSIDSTASIVGRYLARYDWIEMIQMPRRRDRSFAAKVYSFNAGHERVKNLEYEVIGNIDADISFDEDHFEFLLNKFGEDSTLGVGVFFFQAEDGIRDLTVTGVQTCALPICRRSDQRPRGRAQPPPQAETRGRLGL